MMFMRMAWRAPVTVRPVTEILPDRVDMPDFERLFDELEHAEKRLDRLPECSCSWTLITSLALSAFLMVIAYHVTTPSRLPKSLTTMEADLFSGASSLANTTVTTTGVAF